MGEEDGSDGDDQGNHNHNHNDNDKEEVVEEVDPVVQYEAMRESIQKECHVSSTFFSHQVTHFG
jgi:hypothetical protein